MPFANCLLNRRIFILALLIPVVADLSLAQGKTSAQRAQKARPTTSKVPAPRDVIGFTPGDDRKLASWAQIVDYFKHLERASDRIKFQELGKTTLGRPFVFATISSPANLARLERFKEIQHKLADPRTFSSNDAVAEKLIAEGRTIVLITCGIHSTEVGGNLVSMNIAYRLASDDSPETREILDRCIVLLVPSLNPDGVDIVKNWYDKTLGTPAEGTNPPELYHHYTGHDNNRDWYAFTQVETQLTIDNVQNVWHPQIVHDIHQQGDSGSRFFIPPYVEPWEPNVPPIIQAGVNFMGSSMAWELIAAGKAGVVTNGVYDAWTPARAYQHYHGGIRILSETASARIASPTNIAFDKLTPQIGVNPKVRSANFPLVWPGGEWKLANIVDYMQAGAFALMRNAARYRERWLRDFYLVGKDAVRERKPGEPFAFLVLPPKGSDPWGREGFRRLIAILRRGDVEVHEAAEGLEIDGTGYPKGTAFVPMAQPYASFAKTLLERQSYPDLREYPGGPPRRPYDVTAHTLPLLMGVSVVRLDRASQVRFVSKDQTTIHSGPIEVAADSSIRLGPLLAPTESQLPSRKWLAVYQSFAASMDEGWTRWILEQFNLGYSSINEADVRGGNLELKFVAKGTEIPYHTKEEAKAAAKSTPPGGDQYTDEWEIVHYRERPSAGGVFEEGWVVVGKNAVITGLDMRQPSARSSQYSGSVYAVDFSLTPAAASRFSEATGNHIHDRLAIVISGEVKSAPSIATKMGDRGQITGNFTKESAEDLARSLGPLRSRFDCIIIPAQSSQQILNGLPKDRYPEEVAGGLGQAGVESLRQFVEDGGAIINLNEASQFAIDKLGVPVKNVLEGVPAKDFYCPGSILRIKIDTSSPITRDAPMLESSRDESIAWVEGALAFEPTSNEARVIARFADVNELLLSGWLLGGEKIAGKGAIVEVKRGKGRVIMFAFRPQYRGQSIATLPLLFNAILTSTAR